MKQQLITKAETKNNNANNERKKTQSTKKISKEKREAQVRSFFGRHFTNKEVSTIYQRLEPLIKNLPGK